MADRPHDPRLEYIFRAADHPSWHTLRRWAAPVGGGAILFLFVPFVVHGLLP